MEGQVADVARMHRASLRKVKSVESVGRRKNAPSGGRHAATRRFGIKTWQISASKPTMAGMFFPLHILLGQLCGLI